uniref:Sigma 54 modulation/S30EA ribosomal protein C-terminal domain-containing protein n=1 Tax=Corethron hystrix TaxID=216773 RepID=A0A7S1FRB2_9STRA|mmetsp:Transcript_21656/g.49264  ORF Transcript_21656/g.49264 Transcript_21656/m.49264 type:complete len:258 (+) Transcript_21656:100-873(+)
MHLTTSLLFSALSVAPTFAFTSSRQLSVPHKWATSARNTVNHRHAFLQMSSIEANTVPIVITGNNVEVTPSLMEYVNSKLDNVIGKLSSGGVMQSCDVHLNVNRNPKVKEPHTAEVVAKLKGLTIRCAQTTPDMYASIDFVADRLKRKLRQFKERREDGFHDKLNIGENLASVLNAMEEDLADIPEEVEEEFVDVESTVVTKIKSFDLSKGISIKEAIFALDYIDHDFYVFKDEESGEVSVVYKRNAGGVGLIQPEA